MRKRFAALTVLGPLSAATILCAGLMSGAAPAPGPSGYHVVKTVSIPGDEGWDYLSVDAAARRVYISHGSHVVVMNADTYAVEGDVPDTQGVHGIALAPDLGRGFISATNPGSVVIFDLKIMLSWERSPRNPILTASFSIKPAGLY